MAREKGAPAQIEAKNLADYLGVMTQSVMQSGMSWEVVEKKWPGMLVAFHGFDPQWLANISPEELDALSNDTRVIRNRRKIEAVVHNARTGLALESEHGSFRNYLNSFASYEDAEGDMKKRFKFLGDMGVYHTLWIVKHPVPDYDEWCRTHGRVHEHV
ncbi:MAG: DNA-3-methyladenine glycosylase I [Dehalococcoidia bacterium]